MVSRNLKITHYLLFLKTLVASMGTHKISWKPYIACRKFTAFIFLINTGNIFRQFVLAVTQYATFGLTGKKITPATASSFWVCTVLKIVIIIIIKNREILFILICIYEFFIFNITVHVAIPVLVVRNDFCDDRNFRLQCFSATKVSKLPARKFQNDWSSSVCLGKKRKGTHGNVAAKKTLEACLIEGIGKGTYST